MFLSDNSDVMHIHWKTGGFKAMRGIVSLVSFLANVSAFISIKCDAVNKSAGRGGDSSDFGANQII